MRSVQIFRVFVFVSILCGFSIMAIGQSCDVRTATISLSPPSLSFGSGTGNGGFQVNETSTCSYRINPPLPNWIHTTTSGLFIGVTVDANLDLCSRSGTVPVQLTDQSGNGGATASGLVFQAAASGDFSLSANPLTQSVSRGQSVSYTINISRTGGFSGNVGGFSASGMPSGVDAAFSNFTSTSATLTLTASGNPPAGSFPITVSAVNTCQSRSTTVTLIVNVGVANGMTTAVNPILNTMDVDFIANDGDVRRLSYNGAWSQLDLSALTGAPAASTTSSGVKTIYNSIGSSMEVHYLGADQHVHTLWYRGGWNVSDLMTTGAPNAVAASPLDAIIDPITNTEEVYYIATDQHIHQLWFDGAWHTQDLSPQAGAINAGSGSPLAADVNTVANTVEAHYIGTDQHVHTLWYNGVWNVADLTAQTGAPNALATSPLTAIHDPLTNTMEVEFIAADAHVHVLWFNTNGWHTEDLTAMAGAPNAISGSNLATGLNSVDNTMEVHYVGTNQHIYTLWNRGDGIWNASDLTASAGAPLAIPSSPLTTAFDSIRSVMEVEYTSADGHVHQLWFDANGWHTQDLTAQAGG